MSTMYPGPMVPDVAGRDLCGGGDLPDARHGWIEPNTERPADPLLERLLAEEEVIERKAAARRTLSDMALELVNGQRAAEYAPPDKNMKRIGETWAAMLGLDHPIASWRVALMLAALKVIRAANTPSTDSLVDACGYLEIARSLRPDASLAWHDVGLVGAHRDRAISTDRSS